MAAPKRRRIPVTIDMTPMVDIAFLLLIFFMSTTVFKKPEEVSVQIPTSHAANQLPETGIIVITVPKDNTVLMTLENGRLDLDNGLAVMEGRKLTPIRFQPDGIADPIKNLLRKGLVEKVVLKADRDAEYGTIEKIMETLQKNEMYFVNLVTNLEEN